MASAAAKVFTITAILCLVPPAAASDTDHEHDCFAYEGFTEAACPPGKRIGDSEKDEPSCVLCDIGETFIPHRNRCQVCLPCGGCSDGYRVNTTCTLTANVTCELIPVEVNTTTSTPTDASTVSTSPTQGHVGRSTESNGEDLTTAGLEPPQGPLKKGGDEWKRALMIILGVMLLTAVIANMYQAYYIRQLRRDQPVAVDQEQPGATSGTGRTSDALAREEGSGSRLLENGAGGTSETDGNAYAITEESSL